ncbi:sigma-54 dependent transcriptional regulator [Cucumibacter marinus]|uniref:sigma-54 dependent transcriptional regulator n=1 Tax=Cucumibacter marinus TaxID=1121252 RepID=UPI00040B78F7|nr:sigma-54 dependent transcriptional regulator [Cucumibacter marinus]
MTSERDLQARYRVLSVGAGPVLTGTLCAAEKDGTLASHHAAASYGEAVQTVREGGYNVVLAGLNALGDDRVSVEHGLSRLVKLAEGALVLALSEGGSVSAAVTAMQAGAHDYVALPVGIDALIERLNELSARHGLARPHEPASLGAGGRDFASFIGSSPQMRVVYEQIERIAPSAAPVFITGQSGTGKELCAEAVHARSPRGDAPFIAINCGAIPRDLMEAELFGAVRGAYTGAVDDRKGAAEAAEGGTLFLDEIGELDLSLQAKLLRFLQTGTITRIGETVSRPVNVRIICATNRNPIELTAKGHFREDLFYRLHVLPIHLPPLRQRPADILSLAESFLHQYASEEGKRFDGFDPRTAALFLNHDWPGNVRQLQNLIRRIVVMQDGGLVVPEVVAEADHESASGRASILSANTPKRFRSAEPRIRPLWLEEKRIIESALAAFNGNISQAAAALEISPSTIYRKKQSWETLEMAEAS